MQLSGQQTSLTVELLVLQAEGATVLLLDNTLAKHALLFEAVVEGNFVVTQTSRGPQPGDWCEERNEDSFAAGVRTQWRRFKIEDAVRPASRQMVSMHFAVSLEWETEVLSTKATVVPVAMAGARPTNHPFAPYAIRGETLLPPGLEPEPQTRPCAPEVQQQQQQQLVRPFLQMSYAQESREEAELQLALQMSLQEVQLDQQPKKRWGRRNKSEAVDIDTGCSCSICCEAMQAPSPLQCCAQVCFSCASHWATEQESQGLSAIDLRCPQCQGQLEDSVLRQLLSKEALRRVQERLKTAAPAPGPAPQLPAATLARLGLKQCPGCGEGLQKESETCHKMICRTCRARFCFRCLTRLEPRSPFSKHIPKQYTNSQTPAIIIYDKFRRIGGFALRTPKHLIRAKEFFNCGCTGAEHRFIDPVDGRVLLHQ